MKMRIALALLAVALTISLTGCQSPAAQPLDQPTIETEQTEQPKSEKPKQPLTKYQVSWKEDCTVEQAFTASGRVLEKLGLEIGSDRTTRAVTTRDPKTGRTTTKRVPVSNYVGNDQLSATIGTKNALNITFRIEMYLQSVSPAITHITIKAESADQAKEVLQEQSKIVRQQISEAIQKPEQVTEELPPYPNTMIFDRTVNQVYTTIYRWSENFHFERDTDGQGQFYKRVKCQSDSDIVFVFTMRLINTNKTKLQIDISNFEDKDEFKMILQGLLETLEELKKDEEPKITNTEIIMLNEPVSSVYNTLTLWAKENRFSESKYSGGDLFYRYCSFDTTNRITFGFKMYLIGPDQTKLEMKISGQEGKEDFPMILKSLKETLSELDK